MRIGAVKRTARIARDTTTARKAHPIALRWTMKVDIDPEDAKTVTTDERGRACLGPEHADKEIEVVILSE